MRYNCPFNINTDIMCMPHESHLTRLDDIKVLFFIIKDELILFQELSHNAVPALRKPRVLASVKSNGAKNNWLSFGVEERLTPVLKIKKDEAFHTQVFDTAGFSQPFDHVYLTPITFKLMVSDK